MCKSKRKSKLNIAISCVLLSLGSSAYAGGSADFTMDGAQVTSSNININASQTYSLNYNGGSNSCTNVEWYVRNEGKTDWDNFDHNGSATLAKIHSTGSHELKLTSTGYDGRWFFNLFGCDHRGQNDERMVNLDISTPGHTQTKNPVMLVPGVMAWDHIPIVEEYFFHIADEIEKDSDFPVKDVSLAAWQNTEDRGADLAEKILDFLIINDDQFFEEDSTMKVNLIAHSHGSTTSRMAINILAKAFEAQELDNRKVASLTTVAGPHYGTPSADGSLWAVENWGQSGKFLEKYVIDALIGDLAGMVTALLSGHLEEYPEQDILSVLTGFTQKGMARFNTCYPSVGVPAGGKYFIEAPLEGNEPYIPFPEIVDGQVTFDDCQNYTANEHDKRSVSNPEYAAITGGFERGTTFSKSSEIVLADIPNEAYGANNTLFDAPVYGNGLGIPVEANDPTAIRYFSFTGSAVWNTRFGFRFWDGEHLEELSDAFLLVMSSLYPIVGTRTGEDYLDNWLGDTIYDLVSGDAVARTQGYTGASDAFIPVDSTPFGQHIATYQGWNHVDETNGLWGLVGQGAADPIEVYRTHINRLQLSGL